MANTVFKLRRSSVPGKVPNTDILSIGELALNLTDRKLYSSDGTNIFETGSNLTSLSVFSDIKVGNSSVNTSINSSSISVSFFTGNTTTNSFAIGTSAYFVSNGNFGLGNSVPTTKLSVSGTSNFVGNIFISNSNVVVSNGQLDTSANDGFLYIPTCNGTPTGTPATYAGTAAIVIDVANNKLYFYSNNTWNSVVSMNNILG